MIRPHPRITPASRVRFLNPLGLVGLLAGWPAAAAELIRLITLNPGHFHAALFQKDMLPEVADRVHVYAPLGPDLLGHLNRIAQFNSRPDHPTRWRLEVHAGPDFLERMLAERPGNVVVLSGRNRDKIKCIEASVRAGLHVLADKPWIITPDELPRLQTTLDAAAAGGVVAFDAMTQRFEITCLLPRALVQDQDLFGTPLTGSLEDPAVRMESVHYLFKEVAGAPMLRPAWFFDIAEVGEGLTDVGTHLVDLVPWTLFPDQPLDYRQDVSILRAARWPTRLSLAQFQGVTGEREFPGFARRGESQATASQRHEGDRHEGSAGASPYGETKGHGSAGASPHRGEFDYYANNTVQYTLRGIHVRLDVKWDFAAPPGAKDTELAIFRGSLCRVEVRQGPEQNYVPEVYVTPNRPEQLISLRAALQRRLQVLQETYPGLALQEQPARFRLVIPERYRIGHEAHFSLLVRQFLQYVREPRSVPAWEKANLMAKYYVTTRGVELARRQPAPSSPHSKKP